MRRGLLLLGAMAINAHAIPAIDGQPPHELPAPLELVPGGPSNPLIETSISEPFMQTGHYRYAHGEVFRRWIYSPWARVVLVPSGIRINATQKSNHQAFVAAEHLVKVNHLKKLKKFNLTTQIDYRCEGDVGCGFEVAGRCYGYQRGAWGKLWSQESLATLMKEKGSATVDLTGIPAAKCSGGVSLSFKSFLPTKATAMVLKNLRLRLVGVKPQTPKAH